MAMRETTKMEYDGLLAGGITAFTKNVALSLIHISEPTRRP